MMPKLEYFLVAQSIADDKNTNLVSLFHVLEEFSVDELPATVPSLVAVSSWLLAEEDQGEDFQVTLKICHDDATSLLPDVRVNFTADGLRQRIYHYVHNLELDRPGEIKMFILLNFTVPSDMAGRK
ncbi:MAG: hypothetical protein JW888_16860 [Pirellulales bacterium]|nr:hypothetical protein [Pirellulales bacterium]